MQLEAKKSAMRVMLIILFVVLVVFLFIYKNNNNEDQLLSGQTYERVSYDAIGTASSPTTTNSVYGGNTKTIVSGGLENLHLDIRYTPASHNSVLYVLIEGSNDNGTTYFPMGSKSVGTTDVKLYSEGVSSTVGIPITFPGDSTTASGTLYSSMIDFDLVADHVKISAKESTTSTKGTAYIRATLTNKK